MVSVFFSSTFTIPSTEVPIQTSYATSPGVVPSDASVHHDTPHEHSSWWFKGLEITTERSGCHYNNWHSWEFIQIQMYIYINIICICTHRLDWHIHLEHNFNTTSVGKKHRNQWPQQQHFSIPVVGLETVTQSQSPAVTSKSNKGRFRAMNLAGYTISADMDHVGFDCLIGKWSKKN